MEDPKQNFIECKGCKFVIEDKKIVLHLIKFAECRKNYSKSEYDSILDQWIDREALSKSAVKSECPNDRYFECKNCKTIIIDNKLLQHLKNENLKCRDSYTKAEFAAIYEIWFKHAEKQPQPYTLEEMVDPSHLPTKRSIRCKHCLTPYLPKEIKKLKDHLKANEKCRNKYTKEEYLYIGREAQGPPKDRLEGQELTEDELKDFLDLEYVPSSDKFVKSNSKPIFIEKEMIMEFGRYDQSGRFGDPSNNSFAIVLGYEDDFGYHCTEMIYPSVQSISKYAKKIPHKIKAFVENTETFKKYNKDQRFLVCMAGVRELFDYWSFNCQEAHVEENWREMSRNVITMKHMYYLCPLKKAVSKRDFFALNEAGSSAVSNCNFYKKIENHTCQEDKNLVPRDLFYTPNVKFTYSSRIHVFNFKKNPFQEEYIGAPLFDKSYFAPILPSPHITIHQPAVDSSSDSEEGEIIERDFPCEGCHELFWIKSIQIHLASTPSCRAKYNDSQMASLKVKVEEYKRNQRAIYEHNRYSKMKQTPTKSVALSTRVGQRPNIKEYECIACEKAFPLSSIKKHIFTKDSKCIDQYDKHALDEINLLCKENITEGKKMYDSKRNQQLKDLKHNEQLIKCKSCGHDFTVKTIKKHLSHPKCKCSNSYSEEDFQHVNDLVKSHRKKLQQGYDIQRKGQDSEKIEKLVFCLENESEFEFCLFCKKPFELSKIRKHLGNSPECKNKYSKEALKALDSKCNKWFNQMRRKRNAEKKAQ